ncbi:hypothetical protein [Maridesulfovibrio sp.]|uniref:hypothetical protein n=1 Tax=Maridesulfovibrio sp. TaxID=2795000 RepID=UPI0029F59019|nr:hypothetical protein [Maridesulfovibrio sp.]
MSTETTHTEAAPQQPNTSQPVMGPDQGQPHFSYTTPGDPYQGAPVAGNMQPVYQQPMQQPVYQQPMQQPVYQQPMQQPVYQQPMQQPVYQQPMQQPVYQQPMQQPVYQQPMQQPVYQQPMQQPVYQQPMQQPIQQPLTQAPNTSEEQVKQFVDLVKDTAEGKADPASFLSFFNGIDDGFWKGLLVGAGITFVCTSKTVRSIFYSGGKEEMSAEEKERMEDLKAEQEYMAAQAAKAEAEKE